MKKSSILFFYTLIYLAAPAQQKEVFYDDFSSNKNKWAEQVTDDLTAKIENGKFTINCIKKDDGFFNAIPTAVDSSRNFSISVTVSFLNNPKTTHIAGLKFCSNNLSYYLFAISPNGKWIVMECKNRIKPVVLNAQASKFINLNLSTVNKLRIDKKENTWYFFINDSAVCSLQARKYYGHYAGIYCNGNVKTEFDDFKVTGTPLAGSGSLCAVFPVIYQSAKDDFSYIMGRYSTSEDFLSLVNVATDETGASISYMPKTNMYMSLIKQYTTKKEALAQLHKIALDLQKCLPYYAVTELKDEMEIDIREKAVSNPPEATIKIVVNEVLSRYSFFLSVNSKPVE